MPRASLLQSSFALGEITPLAYARVDDQRRKQAVALCQNFIPVVQGALVRRPGTTFVAEVKDSTKKTLLLPFEFSNTQAYVLEFGDQYIRFFSAHGVVGGPLEVVTPYRTADLPNLRITQSADVLYIVHPSYAPRKLTRVSALSWTLNTITFQDGPYLSVNATATTITPSAVSGAGITLTASAALFASTDVGRHVRLQHGSTWGWARITAYTDTTHVTATVVLAFGATTATSAWRLGLWSDTTGYPAVVCFNEDRLSFGGMLAYPQRVDCSGSADYENFTPTQTNGTVLASHALSFTLLSRKANPVFWMRDNDKGLVAGAFNGEWLLRPSTNSEAMSPTNINAKMHATNGSANVDAVELEKSIIYVQRGGRKIRDFYYDVNMESYTSPDISLAGEHMTQSGIVQMAPTKTPQPMVWMVRNDGVLVCLTYNKENRIVGWHRHVLGGTDAKVESIAVIPEPNGMYEELWMIVSRTVNGATKRYVEYMAKMWEVNDQLEDAFYVDCGLTYSGTPATVIAGLSHLPYEYVDILADGARMPALQVDATGTITLPREASKVTVGLGYQSIVKLLPPEAGSADGTALGKSKRVDHVAFWFSDTVGGKFGASLDDEDLVLVRSSFDAMDAPPPLFNGMWLTEWDGDYDREMPVYLVQDYPFPMTLLAVMLHMETQDAV